MSGAFSCFICLAEAPNTPVVTCCGHLFCFVCIKTWILSSQKSPATCPVCKGILKDPSSLILLRTSEIQGPIDSRQDAQAVNDRNNVCLKRKRRRSLVLDAQVNIPISRMKMQNAECIEVTAEYSVRGFEARRKVHVTPVVGIRRCTRHKEADPPVAHERDPDVESRCIKPGERCSDLFNDRNYDLSKAVVINPPSLQIKGWYGEGRHP
ncbi:hypothetical protein KP509_19G046400 [Ceratopteris richardii]|uniref:RING-type E3 ubiquitin transferase n=1 Tax=Ceratopteris richardii TaxID=49495 RepID=A0A8T2SKU1_CERRI|nr:hypothetical protein KP509_19G046400 [Ceratopteris richardii]